MSYSLKLKMYALVISVAWLSACGVSQPSITNSSEATRQVSTNTTNELISADETAVENKSSGMLTSPATTNSTTAPTRTPLPTSTLSNNPTPVENATHISTTIDAPTATAVAPPLAGPLIAFAVEGSSEYYLVLFDVGTRTFREIRNEFVDHPFHITWFDEGCTLNVGAASLDLRGNLVWYLPELDWETLRREGSTGVGMTWLSTDRAWLAFSELSGEQTFFDAEIVNVSTVSLQSRIMPVRLSSNGGARTAA